MKNSPEYQAAVVYLLSFGDFSMTKGQVYTAETFDLSRMKALLALMENPQLNYPVIHIAGSKGKGSTAAMIASILREAGYRVGLYTSPHLFDYNERMQINGQAIEHEKFISLVEEYKSKIERVPKITSFEAATALAFQYFSDEAVEIAVVEVGLGGRLDATNLVQPLLSVITAISLDHTAILGDTLEKIATEKAGILKPGVAVILARQSSRVMKHLERIAVERGCEACVVDEFVQWNLVYSDIYHQEVAFSLRKALPWEGRLLPGETLHVTLPLVGEHQIENAATALMVALWLGNHGINIPLDAIIDGFSHTMWPGRFEVVVEHPLFIVDSAHNLDSAQRLKTTIDQYLPDRPLTMIFGASEDKDVRGMLSVFKKCVKHFIFTESNHPRAMSVDRLEEIGYQLGLSFERVIPAEDAVLSLKASLAADEACIATGSIFTAAAVKKELMACYTQHVHHV
jgi:dihydrofolate synthase/folylpolyglutamate synthase